MNFTRRGVIRASTVGVLGAVSTQSGSANTANPDAELISVCAEFDALYQKTIDIHEGPNAIADDDLAAAAVAPLDQRMDTLLDRMETLQATTPRGIQARARSLALNASEGWHKGWFTMDALETVPGRLLSYLMRDAGRIA